MGYPRLPNSHLLYTLVSFNLYCIFESSLTLIFIKLMLLKEILKSKGIKQKWFANKIGVSEVTVSNWCSGKSIPKKEHLQKISELLEVPINSIIHV